MVNLTVFHVVLDNAMSICFKLSALKMISTHMTMSESLIIQLNFSNKLMIGYKTTILALTERFYKINATLINVWK